MILEPTVRVLPSMAWWQPGRVEEAQRARAVEVVRRLMEDDTLGEEEEDDLLDELEALVPDPRVSALVYWPQRHERAAGRAEAELTPEVIVELALQYRPFAL